jgi:hypothetical protein
MQPDRPHFNSIAAVCISLVMTILSVLLTVPMFVTAEVRKQFCNLKKLEKRKNFDKN